MDKGWTPTKQTWDKSLQWSFQIHYLVKSKFQNTVLDGSMVIKSAYRVHWVTTDAWNSKKDKQSIDVTIIVCLWF